MERNTALARSSLSLFFVIFLLIGCKKSNNNTPNSDEGISASFNGISWQSQTTSGDMIRNGVFVTLGGKYKNNKDSSFIDIYVPDSSHINKPTLLVTSGWGGIDYVKPDGTVYASDQGSITVTSWDTTAHRIAGTFTATLTDFSSISFPINGRFNVSYDVR